MSVSLSQDAYERKAAPMAEGLLWYFPNALAEVARVSKAGNDQHNAGKPLHHSRGKSTDHADCIVRHLVDAGTIDSDGQRHSAKVAWRALALLQEEIEREDGVPLPRNAWVDQEPAPSTAHGHAAEVDAACGCAVEGHSDWLNSVRFPSICLPLPGCGEFPSSSRYVDEANSLLEIVDQAARRVEERVAAAQEQTFGEFKRTHLTAKQLHDIKLAADLAWNAGRVKAQHPMHAETLRERDASGV